MGLNQEDAKSFEDMAAEMDAAPEAVAENTETVAETTEEATADTGGGVTETETPAE